MKRILFSIILLLQVFIFSKELERIGNIEGKVVEYSTTNPLYGATIIVKGTLYGATANENGIYKIENVPAGIYQVEVSMIGYETKVREEVTVSPNRVTTLNFELIPTAIELNKAVNVTAGFFDVDPEKNVSTKLITPQEIKSSAGSAEDAFKVIRVLPGITTGSLANANLIVRGGSPDENLALLDNIEIYSPMHFGKVDASMGIISIINPDLLESAEFSSGGFPVEYGDKISSLFELKMKEGNSSKFNSDVNFNMAGFGLYTDGPVSENSNLIFSARRGIFDLITKLMGRDAAPSYWDLAGKYTYNLSNKNKLSLVGFYYKDDMEKNSEEPESHMAEESKYKYVKRGGYGSAMGINWTYLFSNKGFSLTTISYTGNGWNAHLGNGIDNNLRGEDLFESELSLKNETVFKVNNHIDLKAGLFYKLIKTDHYSWIEEEITNTGKLLPAATIYYNPPNTFKTGLFIQSILQPLERLLITGGVRYDYFDLTKEKIVSPRVSASYKIAGGTALNASYGKYSQSPYPYQMQINEQTKNLKSSHADQYILGIESILRDDIKISLEVYYKDLSKTFVTYDTSRTITNNGSGYVKGLEIFIQKKMMENLVGSISYSYSVSKRKDNDGLPLYYFDYDRTHNFSLVGSYKLSDTWQAGLRYTYATGMPYTSPSGVVVKNNKYYILNNERNTSRLPDYHELDIRIDKKFNFNNWTLTMYFDLWNVYNRNNIVDYTFSTDDNGNIRKIPAEDFKIMPIFGISAQL